MNVITSKTNPSIYVGLDVHKKTINLAAQSSAGGGYLLERVCTTADLSRLRKDLKKLSRRGTVFCCYEASAAGFDLHRKITEWGFNCQVIAPSMIPKKAGQRRKNDRLDARRLAEYYRSGLLTPVHVPTAQEEAVRDVLRCRAAVQKDLKRAKARVVKFLRRRGHTYTIGRQQWTQRFRDWVYQLKLPLPVDRATLLSYMEIVEFLERKLEEKDREISQIAQTEPYQEPVSYLRGFRGVDTQGAMTLVAELGDVRRFAGPKELMAYLGLVPSEHSSGDSERRGSITKTGNSFCRHVLVQAAWCYRFRPYVSKHLRKRQQGLPDWVIEHSWKAQKRLHSRLQKLSESRNKNIAVVGGARELAGFLGAVLVQLAENRQWDCRRLGKAVA